MGAEQLDDSKNLGISRRSIAKLKEYQEDPDVPVEDRERIRLALVGEGDDSAEEILEFIQRGEILDELQTFFEAENFKNDDIPRMRELMKMVGNADTILEELKPDLLIRFFNMMEGRRGKKPYILPLKIKDEDLPEYLDFELNNNDVEYQDDFLYERITAPLTTVTANLLASHLNTRPAFLPRILQSSRVTEEDLKELLKAVKEHSGPKSYLSIVLDYLLFDPDRRELADKYIKAGKHIGNKNKIAKKIRRRDRLCFDNLSIRPTY